jgi:glycosyltransferase involved in cell wall biosynthesis
VTGRSFEIWVCGDGEQKEEFVSNVKLHNSYSNVKITYLGQVGNGIEILSKSDVLFNCSISEGLPISLLEAMSVGVICLASDVPGNRDVIDHGFDGLLYPSGNIDIAKNELIKIINNEKKYDEVIINAWWKHRLKFTDDKCFSRLQDLYATL